MSKRLTGLNPLAYLGVEATMPPNMYMSRSAPTSNDSRNFNIGDFWIDITTETLYVLVNLDGGVATWITTFGGATTNFVTNSGTATESGGAINILGDGTNIITSGAGSTVSIAFGTSPIIDNLTLTGNLHVEGTTTLDSTLTLTGFTGGVLTSNGSGVVGEVATTNHSLLVGNSSGTITSLGAATNGQIPIGSTGNNPVLATITAGTGVGVSNGAGTITLSATGSFASPVTVPNGGTGDSSFTAYAVICGGTTSTGALQNVSGLGTSGYVLTSTGAGALPTWQANSGSGGASTFDTDSGTATASSNTITIHGAGGITTSGSGSTVTITGGGSTGITWTTVTGSTSSMAVNNGYIANNSGGVAFTLPATAAVGSELYVVGIGTGGWTIAQNSGQNIYFGVDTTTTGVSGSLASTNAHNTITLVCSIANTTFSVIAVQGNITVV